MVALVKGVVVVAAAVMVVVVVVPEEVEAEAVVKLSNVMVVVLAT